MAIKPGKKPDIAVRIGVVRPRFKPFKTVGRPHAIKGRLKRGRS